MSENERLEGRERLEDISDFNEDEDVLDRMATAHTEPFEYLQPRNDYNDSSPEPDEPSRGIGHCYNPNQRSPEEDEDDIATGNLDFDVVQRMRSRASVRSEGHDLKKLEAEYPDGAVKLPLSDSRQPKNWTTGKKLAHTMAFGFTTLTAQFSASVFSPAIPQVAEELHVGTEVAVLAFSIYVLGNMVGPVIFAPLSEVYGRKIAVFIPCFIGGVFMCICANVTNIAALTVFRFLAGVFNAAPIVSSGGAMADLWSANSRAAALVLYAGSIVIGSSGSPALGGLLTDTGHYGWRWTTWLGGLLCIAVSIVNLLLLSETFWPVVEQRIVRNLRLDTGHWELHTEHDKWNMTVDEFLQIHFARPILMFLTPIMFLMVSYASFVYGLLFLMITSVGREFQRVYHFAYAASFCPLLALFVGYLFGGAINIVQSTRYARIAHKLGHTPDPEARLPAMMGFAWLLPCGMFLYGWTLQVDIHWIVPTIGLGFVGAAIAVIFQGCLVYMTDVYTKYAASAIAANTILRSVFGGVFPLFATQMNDGLGVHWASSLLGFVAAALWPVPWFFYFYGNRIRQRDPFKKKLEM